MEDELGSWRKEIDTIDEKIISLIAKRITVVKKIGKYKSQKKIVVRDEKRWNELLQTLVSKGKQLNLPEAFIKNLYTVIHEYMISIQKK